jgi:hypothetical protein
MGLVMVGHRIRWFARVSPCEEAPDGYLPRGPYMAGKDWGWDARCSCGWSSRTGGAIQQRIRDAIAEHKWDVENGFD